MELNPNQLKELRRRGHHLKPVVLTGAAGLSNAVIEEIGRALTDHELIKVKLSATDKAARQAMTQEIEHATGAIAVQLIGRTALLYRENPEPD